MRIAAQIAVELLGNGEPADGEGHSCVYYQLSSDIGLKTYDCEIEAYNTYVTQLELSAKNLAPECWGFCECDGISAYFTEHVLTAVEAIGRMSDTMTLQESQERIRTMLLKMRSDFVDAGFKASDFAHDNYGVKGDRVVMLDVGHCYTSDGVRCGERYEWNAV